MKEDRRAVIGGGVSVLRALMELLNIERLLVAQGALRHGVLFDMVEREGDTSDARDVSVQRLAQKFAVDAAQSLRVQQVATHLYQQLDPAGGTAHARAIKKLGWAAALHEVGIAISHSDYHKHGAYILDNADMLGFSMPELHRLGLLVLGQRGKLKKLDSSLESTNFTKLLLALRLAIILCHARKNPEMQGWHLSCHDTKRNFTLSTSNTWALEHPQSAHLLRQESIAWQKTLWSFEFVTTA
jgi:exopolyphosphatase/guanosine-5'-triphosphate,3'-diphosphate pyrophosphatase